MQIDEDAGDWECFVCALLSSRMWTLDVDCGRVFWVWIFDVALYRNCESARHQAARQLAVLWKAWCQAYQCFDAVDVRRRVTAGIARKSAQTKVWTSNPTGQSALQSRRIVKTILPFEPALTRQLRHVHQLPPTLDAKHRAAAGDHCFSSFFICSK